MPKPELNSPNMSNKSTKSEKDTTLSNPAPISPLIELYNLIQKPVQLYSCIKTGNPLLIAYTVCSEIGELVESHKFDQKLLESLQPHTTPKSPSEEVWNNIISGELEDGLNDIMSFMKLCVKLHELNRSVKKLVLTTEPLGQHVLQHTGQYVGEYANTLIEQYKHAPLVSQLHLAGGLGLLKGIGSTMEMAGDAIPHTTKWATDTYDKVLKVVHEIPEDLVSKLSSFMGVMKTIYVKSDEFMVQDWYEYSKFDLNDAASSSRPSPENSSSETPTLYSRSLPELDWSFKKEQLYPFSSLDLSVAKPDVDNAESNDTTVITNGPPNVITNLHSAASSENQLLEESQEQSGGPIKLQHNPNLQSSSINQLLEDFKIVGVAFGPVIGGALGVSISLASGAIVSVGYGGGASGTATIIGFTAPITQEILASLFTGACIAVPLALLLFSINYFINHHNKEVGKKIKKDFEKTKIDMNALMNCNNEIKDLKQISLSELEEQLAALNGKLEKLKATILKRYDYSHEHKQYGTAQFYLDSILNINIFLNNSNTLIKSAQGVPLIVDKIAKFSSQPLTQQFNYIKGLHQSSNQNPDIQNELQNLINSFLHQCRSNPTIENLAFIKEISEWVITPSVTMPEPTSPTLPRVSLYAHEFGVVKKENQRKKAEKALKNIENAYIVFTQQVNEKDVDINAAFNQFMHV